MVVFQSASAAKAADRKQLSADQMIAAGVAAIAQLGIDHVTVQSICGKSGHSRPTFYSYFGDLQGLFAEIWIRHGVDWLNKLCSVGGLSPRSDVDLALTEIFATAHRNPAIKEVVQVQLQEFFDLENQCDSVTMVSVWTAAINLGIALGRPVTPEVEAVRVFNEVFERLTSKQLDEIKAGLPKQKAVEPGEALELDPPNLEDALLGSTLKVVASAGVHNASLVRIARMCRVSTGALYPRFEDKLKLIERAYASAIAEVIKVNFTAFDFDYRVDDQIAEFTVGGLYPNRESWRHFRCEVYLEGRVDQDLRTDLAMWVREGNTSAGKKFIAGTRLTAERGELLGAATSVMGLGFGVLSDLMESIIKQDFRVMLRALNRELFDYQLGTDS